MGSKGDLVHSYVTGKDYYTHEVVRIVNVKQALLYMKHTCDLFDLYVSTDYNSNEPIFCFIFSKEQTKPYFDLWCRHELV